MPFNSPFPPTLQEQFINNRFVLDGSATPAAATFTLNFGFDPTEPARQNTIVYIEQIIINIVEANTLDSVVSLAFGLASGLPGAIIKGQITDSQLLLVAPVREPLFGNAVFTNIGGLTVIENRDVPSGVDVDLDISGYRYRFGTDDTSFSRFAVNGASTDITSVEIKMIWSEVRA